MTRVGARADSRFAWLLAGSLCLASLACDEARSGGSSVVPQAEGVGTSITPEGSFEGESIDELKIRLDRLVGEQDRLTAASSTDAGKCEELCELSRAICEVKTKMCEIADARVADDEYQDLCRQAKQRCQRASDSCIRCVQTHERAYGSSFGRPSGSCAGDPAATTTEPEPEPEPDPDPKTGPAPGPE